MYADYVVFVTFCKYRYSTTKEFTRPEESYRLWCVVVCDLETSRMRRPWPSMGRSATGNKGNYE